MADRTCLLGDDCDLTVAWMAGRLHGKRSAEIELAEWRARAESAEAKLAKIAALMQAARDCADDLEDEVKWRLNGDHPFTIRERNEALEPVIRFRAALAAFDGNADEQGGVAAGGPDAG
jgi:hypothetical protein